MHIVLLTGHTREHDISDDPKASVLFVDYVYAERVLCMYTDVCAP